MSWKVYSLGNTNLNNAATSAKAIISEQLGSCAVDTTAKTFTYTYGGGTYVVTYSSAYPDNKYNYALCLNDATGEFVMSPVTTDYAQSTGYYFMSAAILRINMGDGTTVLAPTSGIEYAEHRYSPTRHLLQYRARNMVKSPFYRLTNNSHSISF